jgi:hypothetical protein
MKTGFPVPGRAQTMLVSDVVVAVADVMVARVADVAGVAIVEP